MKSLLFAGATAVAFCIFGMSAQAFPLTQGLVTTESPTPEQLYPVTKATYLVYRDYRRGWHQRGYDGGFGHRGYGRHW